jgi:hypothetical protein
MMLAISVLVGAFMIASLGRARDAVADTDFLRLENAAESAAHGVLAAPPMELLRTGRVMQTIALDGHQVHLTAQLCDGLVRLRTPSPQRANLLAHALGGDSMRVAASLDRLEAKGALVTWAQVAALPGVGPAGLAQLLPHASLFADPGEPDPTYARRTPRPSPGRFTPTPASPVEAIPTNAIGKLIQVQARASKNGRNSALLLIEARLTGQQPQPLWIHDWLWVDTGRVAEK